MKVSMNMFQRTWFQAVVLVALFICAYWIPLKGIVDTWITDGDYSYGFLIPVISAYLFWDMRARLDKLKVRNAWSIFPILFFFVLLSIYGILGSNENISRPTIPVLMLLFTYFSRTDAAR